MAANELVSMVRSRVSNSLRLSKVCLPCAGHKGLCPEVRETAAGLLLSLRVSRREKQNGMEAGLYIN